MENFEERFCGGYFDDLYEALSEGRNLPEQDISGKIDLPEADMDFEKAIQDMINGLRDVFERHSLHEHLCSVELLGNLSYTDMLMYYCAVMDCMALYECEEEGDRQEKQIVTPEQYVKEKKSLIEEGPLFVTECYKSELDRITEIFRYLKNKEFRILSNTFYLDGSDFIMFLQLKSAVGYSLRIKLVIKCSCPDEAKQLKLRMKEFEISEGFTGTENE